MRLLQLATLALPTPIFTSNALVFRHLGARPGSRVQYPDNRDQYPSHDAPPPRVTLRRDFFLVAASLVPLFTTKSPAVAAGDGAEGAARAQFDKMVTFVDDFDDGYDKVAADGGGDSVRVKLGTAGNNAMSPLYQIDKTLSKLLPEASDVGEFEEAMDSFIYRYRQADSMAYSANFAGGSGKPKPPAVYLQLAHDEVRAMRAERE